MGRTCVACGANSFPWAATTEDFVSPYVGGFAAAVAVAAVHEARSVDLLQADATGYPHWGC